MKLECDFSAEIDGLLADGTSSPISIETSESKRTGEEGFNGFGEKLTRRRIDQKTGPPAARRHAVPSLHRSGAGLEALPFTRVYQGPGRGGV